MNSGNYNIRRSFIGVFLTNVTGKQAAGQNGGNA